MFINAQSIANALEVPDAFVDGFGYATDAVFGGGAAAFESVATYLFPSAVEALNTAVAEHAFAFRKPLPLMSRPVQAFFCIFMYFGVMALIYQYSKRAGKQQYRRLGLIHNAFLFSVSLYMGLGFVFTAMASFNRPWNNPILDPSTDDNGWRMAKMFWLFTISKLAEYGDTYLMVLKHNHRQISFLHLYHHNRFSSPGARIISIANNIELGAPFMVKHVFSSSPVQVLVVSFLFLIVLGAVAMRICEVTYDKYGKEEKNLLDYLWLIIITMATVGYGDIYPVTFCGRLVSVTVALSGLVLAALLTGVVVSKLQLSRREQRVVDAVQENENHLTLRVSSSRILQRWFRWSRARTKLAKQLPDVPLHIISFPKQSRAKQSSAALKGQAGEVKPLEVEVQSPVSLIPPEYRKDKARIDALYRRFLFATERFKAYRKKTHSVDPEDSFSLYFAMKEMRESMSDVKSQIKNLDTRLDSLLAPSTGGSL